MQIDCTVLSYLCHIKQKQVVMGFFDYLLFGALLNSLGNNSNNSHSNNSNGDYGRGYDDGYRDGCMDHDDYDCGDGYDCGCDGFDF